MKKILTVFSILALLAGTYLFPFSNASSQETKGLSQDNGIILFMQGDVKVKSEKSDAWLDAKKGMILLKGDSLKTGPDSWAEIGFGKDFANSVRVQENTHVIFTDLGATKINLIQGELRSLVEKLSKNRIFEIKTAVSVCGVRGTGWDMVTNGKTAEAYVYENIVFFSGLGQGLSSESVILDAGKMGILSDPQKAIAIEDLPVEKMYDWQKWKKDFIERRGAGTGPSPQDRASSAEEVQAATEAGMEKVKPVISDINDERDIDRRLESETTTNHGYE
ncbi:MAG: FecR domain-containing protein [Candidatus Omnitrophica bacterium]|nr:FecR domain-containing protein [Candidatus Omnitrophota bacterium]MBU4488839.1 FecR domain-containing protein [Candidatus Omnitrophota bacterium]MCG2705202.1 FecR domain-containing protein [Candidatus Omnitrophota bacterium]